MATKRRALSRSIVDGIELPRIDSHSQPCVAHWASARSRFTWRQPFLHCQGEVWKFALTGEHRDQNTITTSPNKRWLSNAVPLPIVSMDNPLPQMGALGVTLFDRKSIEVQTC
jgi:hypothetical protein